MPIEHTYIVMYDISSPKRWRRVFEMVKGYGQWVQYSVFQCRLTARRRAELSARLDELIKHNEDHVLILDLGGVEHTELKVESLGKATYQAPERRAVVV